MSTPTPPPYGDPQGQPGYGAPPPGYGAPQPGYGYGPQGYGGHGAPAQRPGQATAAAIVAIVWGALGTLLGLIVMLAAFGLGAALVGLVVLVSLAVSAALLWSGLKVLQGGSPKLLLTLAYVTIGINLLSLVVSLAQDGGNAASGILGFIIPGIVVALLLQPQVKQYYAARGQAY